MTRELPRVAAKIKVLNGAAMAAWAGTMERINSAAKAVSSVGTGPYGKDFGRKGLNEMGGNDWDSGDVWDLNGIHLLTAEPTVAQKDKQMECHAGAQGKAHGTPPLGPDPHAEHIQRVPGEGSRSPPTARCTTSSL